MFRFTIERKVRFTHVVHTMGAQIARRFCSAADASLSAKANKTLELLKLRTLLKLSKVEVPRTNKSRKRMAASILSLPLDMLWKYPQAELGAREWPKNTQDRPITRTSVLSACCSSRSRMKVEWPAIAVEAGGI